jgi:hypothetical protein
MPDDAKVDSGPKRMILDLPLDVQMAIRLRAVKSRKTTGQVVSEAIQAVFAHDIEEAKSVIERRVTHA